MINEVILCGNLGKDPELRRLESGVACAKFSLATSDSYKSKDGERKTETEWHNIILWRGLAEVAEKFLKKGDFVYIKGKITYREYTDKETNQKKYFTEIVGDKMKMLGGKKDESGSNAQPPAKSPSQATTTAVTTENGGDNEPPSDDLPF